MSWIDDLRPASWRGLEFFVHQDDNRFGRNVAIHEYPFRDDPWVEDLGRAARRLAITGFLLGDDVVAQEDAMIEAAEEEGSGLLIHPRYGLRTVNLIDFGTSARQDLGRVVELQFAFIEAGDRLYPTIEAATGALVDSLADLADSASLSDFSSSLTTALGAGSSVATMARNTVGRFTSAVSSISNNAGSVMRAVAGVSAASGSTLGRFNLGGLSSVTTKAYSTAAAALSGLSSARYVVSRSASLVSGLAKAL